ncbi:unnamed protein product [Didymodactylos carnosus]|uniref:ethanolamine-phosphate cytidylyltransferase n=1 Tax=Didymodactylos carnosus TaxID=1234261 RepID=A0A815R2J3_9BILA|nr:unnamed protein product [Didymodactylos carnosus]CAF1471247.1 unnamed protein product [Didymodactylos carnosus]CAF4135426.1 unnamed protein product [Didymodactylos carnosus]CAF4338928.1 unnamed protein product [Didymodactylos carnosus]
MLLFHFGHANACRQAKAMGSYLIVGVHSDAEIAKHKGPPVFTEQERYKLVRAIKWVDEVVENAPYLPTIETLEKYNCAFCVHGDDLTMSTDGVDHLHVVKAAGRMLLMPKTHDECDNIFRDRKHTPCKSSVSSRTYTLQSLSIMDKIKQFSNDRRPNPNDRIIYTCGAYDLFHAGHVSFLEKAKTFGDYLIVGLYTDSVMLHGRSERQVDEDGRNPYEIGLEDDSCASGVILKAVGANLRLTVLSLVPRRSATVSDQVSLTCMYAETENCTLFEESQRCIYISNHGK